MCRSAVNDGSCSPWVMCSCSVVSGNQIRDNITPVLRSLHWLPVTFRIDLIFLKHF